MRICPQCRQRTEAPVCAHDGFKTVDAAWYDEQASEALVGTVFEGRYRIDGLIARGGMGDVYRATQVAVGRPVAIKVLPSLPTRDLGIVARFQQEARAVAALNHPNVIGLIDFGESEARHLYLVLEFAEGPTLHEVVRRDGPLEPARVVRIATQMFDALAAAHRAGVVHRDLTPANLILTRQGRLEDVVKVVDFGIARLTGDAAPEKALTGVGLTLGSPRYMAPEQAMALPVGPAADLYAAGVTAYEMLTGRTPFVCHAAVDYMRAHVQQAPAPPAVEGRLLDGPLVELIMACLEKRPEDRPASADEVVRRLEAMPARCAWRTATPLALPVVAEGLGPSVTRTAGAVEPAEPADEVGSAFARRGRGADEGLTLEEALALGGGRRRRRAAMAAAALLALGGLAWAGWGTRGGPAAEAEAAAEAAEASPATPAATALEAPTPAPEPEVAAAPPERVAPTPAPRGAKAVRVGPAEPVATVREAPRPRRPRARASKPETPSAAAVAAPEEVAPAEEDAAAALEQEILEAEGRDRAARTGPAEASPAPAPSAGGAPDVNDLLASLREGRGGTVEEAPALPRKLTASTIHRTLSGWRGSFERCRETAGAGLSGPVTIETSLRIATDGRVLGSSIKRSGGAPSGLQACVRSVLEATRFPAFREGPMMVTWPVVLR